MMTVEKTIISFNSSLICKFKEVIGKKKKDVVAFHPISIGGNTLLTS